MTFAQRRNRLTTHFSESVPVVKRRTIVFDPLGLDRISRQNSRANFVSLLLPMPSSASHPTTLLSFNSLILLMFLLSSSRLTLSFSVFFFSWTDFGSLPTFPINLLLLLQILLQAILIHAALYSRMKYLSCIYAIIFYAMLYTQPRLQEKKPPSLSNVNTVLLATDHVNVPDQVLFEILLQILFVLWPRIRYNSITLHVDL